MSAFKDIMDSIDMGVNFILDPEKRYLVIFSLIIVIGYKYDFFVGVYYRAKNKRLNEFCGYRDKAKDTMLVEYFDTKIDEMISKRTSRIANYKERIMFIYITSRIDKWEYGDIVLRNIMQYILIGDVFYIDFVKYRKNRKKYILNAILWASLMVLTIVFSIFLVMYLKVDSIFDFRNLLSLILIGCFEILALNNHGKIHKESDMKKYNNALVSIDISELSTKSVILPLHQHRQQQ